MMHRMARGQASTSLEREDAQRREAEMRRAVRMRPCEAAEEYSRRAQEQ